MNLVKNVIISGVILIILILPINIQPVYAQSYFSDNFNASSLSSVWINDDDPGVNPIQSNGVLSANWITLGPTIFLKNPSKFLLGHLYLKLLK